MIRSALALLLLISAAALSADDELCSCGVEAALNEFLAGAADDRSVHERFWAEQLIYTSSSGERFGKAEIMAGFEQDEPAADINSPQPNYSAANIEIRFENELALLTFTLMAESTGESGPSIQRYYNSGVLKNSATEGEPPHWQALLWQATRIPQPVADTAPQNESE